MSTHLAPAARSPARRSRYLAALGVTEWTRRDPAAEPTGAASTLDAALGAVQPEASAPAATPSAAEPARPGEARSLHALVDDRPASPHREAAARSEREDPAPAAPEARPVPRFRLTVLELEGALLVVDDALLEPLPDRRRALAPLGDLLRAGHLLRGRAVVGRVGTRVFHWPQVEGDAVDQTLPRAREALQAFARRRTGEDGFVLRIEPSASASPEVCSVLAALDVLDRPCAGVDSAFLAAAADGAVRRAAWTALRTLEPAA
jgi:hypothetical protein